MVIYRITNLVNGKIYIGQDSKNRKNYLGSGIHIKAAIKKYGRDKFSKEILEICESADQLNAAEIKWIDSFDSRNPKIGYNIAVGGEAVMFGRKHTFEAKEKMKSSAKKHRPNFEGHKHKPESIELMKTSRAKFLESEAGDAYRKKLSVKQTIAKIGIPRTDQAIKAISEGHKKFYKTEHGKMNLKKRKERQIEFYKTENGKIIQKKMAQGRCKHMYEIDQILFDGTLIKTWKNMIELRENHAGWSSNISACLNGVRKQAYGFIWKKHND